MISGIIEVDKNGIPIKPQIILTNRAGTKLGTIYHAANVVMAFHMTQPNEISFDVYKEHDGVRCEVWDELKDFRFIYLPYYDQWFEIQVPINEGEGIVKHVSGFSVYESELSQLMLNDIEIDTEDDLTDRAKKDEASGKEANIENYGTYFYYPQNPSRSLLHRILKDKASHYKIFHIDSSLAKEEREYKWDDTSIMDAFDEIAQELECLFVLGEHDPDDDAGILHRTISVYDLKDVCMDCGHRGVEDGVCPKCGSKTYIRGYGNDTKIFVSRENLSSEIQYETNVDQVKNCFRLAGGDEDMTATIRNINPSGSQYIWYFSDEMLKDMSKSLRDALSEFEDDVNEYASTHVFEIPENTVTKYNELVDKYNQYHENNKFKKIEVPVTGYSSLTDIYYNAQDLASYIEVTLLPSADAVKETNAEEQIGLLTGNMSPIGVKELKTMSGYYADSLVKERVKALVDTSRYRVYVNRESYADLVWEGTITLTSYTDEKDTKTTALTTIEFNGEIETYLRQQIEDAMNSYKNNKAGIVELFKKSDDDFKTALKRYSVDGLTNLASVCQACLNVLIQNHVGEADNENYSNFYVPYMRKLGFIEDEAFVRENELKIISTNETDGQIHTVTRDHIDYVVIPPDLSHQYLEFTTELDLSVATVKITYNGQLNYPRFEIVDEKIRINPPYIEDSGFYGFSSDDKIAIDISVTTSEPVSGLLEFIEAEREESAVALDIKERLTSAQWAELASFRRDQTYSNSNYIVDGLTSSEVIDRARGFIETAQKELKKSATEQHSISGTLYNFLLLVDSEDAEAPDEYVLATTEGENIVTEMQEFIKIHDPLFTPLVRSFELGNWIHLEVDEKVYKLRLTDFEIDFDSIENLSVTFSDVTDMKGFVGDTATLLKSAMAISTSYGYVSRQATIGAATSGEWKEFNSTGMSLDRRRIVSGVDENLLIDGNGFLMRKMGDDGINYEPEQVRIINKGLYYTNDGWDTVGTGIGAITYTDPETGEVINDYGVIAKTIVGKLILGENLGIYNESGSLKINENGFVLTSKADGTARDIFTVQKDNGDGTFDRYIYVNDSGEVIIDGNNVRVGREDMSQTIVDYIDENMPIPDEAEPGESAISVVIESSAGNIFKNKDITAILTCKVYEGSEDITDEVETFKWIKKDRNGDVDETWTRTLTGNTIQITSADVTSKAIFECEVTFYDPEEEEDDETIEEGDN